MNWTQILVELMNLLIAEAPEVIKAFADMVKRWLESRGTQQLPLEFTRPESLSATLGSFAEFREGVKKKLQELIDRRPRLSPVRFFLVAISNRLTDAILNKLYERITGKTPLAALASPELYPDLTTAFMTEVAPYEN